MGEHIVRSFDDDLIAVRAKISEMGGLAEELLSGALQSVQDRNQEQAETVINLDKRLDALEMEVEEMTTRIIALRQPMAQDLRLLIAVLKLSAILERVGDLSKNIARRAIPLAKAAPASITASMTRLRRQALGQVTQVLNAWARRVHDEAVVDCRPVFEVDYA